MFDPLRAIIYEDPHLVVVHKPAGILSIPAPEGGADMVSLVDEAWRRRDGAGRPHLHPCHRLDRDTSGVMVFARGKAHQQAVMEAFARRDTVKIYLAVVNGHPAKDQGQIDLPLEGKAARTQYQVLHRSTEGPPWALLKVKIHTGRTNQIRLHLGALGHALVGDDRFGRRRDFAFPARRTLLHAWFLVLPASLAASLPSGKADPDWGRDAAWMDEGGLNLRAGLPEELGFCVPFL